MLELADKKKDKIRVESQVSSAALQTTALH